MALNKMIDTTFKPTRKVMAAALVALVLGLIQALQAQVPALAFLSFLGEPGMGETLMILVMYFTPDAKTGWDVKDLEFMGENFPDGDPEELRD
jgi:hypothetical protein